MNAHHRYSRYFPALFLFADLFCLNASFYLAGFLRYGWMPFSYEQEYKVLQIAAVLIWTVVFFAARLQEVTRSSKLLDHLNRILTGLVINLSIVFALWFAFEPQVYSRKFLFIVYLSFTLSTLSWRTIWHYTIQYFRTKGYNIRNVLIIGEGDLAQSIRFYFNENPNLGYVHIGTTSAATPLDEIKILANERDTDIIFCCMPDFQEGKVKDVIDFAENNLMKVNLISQFSKLSSYNLTIEQFGSIPIINVNSIPLDLAVNRLIKRVFDIIFSAFVIIGVLSWLVPIVGLLIVMESRGPIFFRQNRHGKDNKLFLCWKFRTMTHSRGAEFKQATKNDNRITRIGAILRKTSIDELPQFINVFLGDMSVVGPRPHPVKLNEEFQPKIDRFWQRHAVKPGITGLAQAKGFRGETAELSDMSGRVKLDRFYVKNWSLLLDFKIIILTVLSIVRGNENAY